MIVTRSAVESEYYANAKKQYQYYNKAALPYYQNMVEAKFKINYVKIRRSKNAESDAIVTINQTNSKPNSRLSSLIILNFWK